MYHKLQYISQGNNSAEHLNNIHEALDAGCLWIQLRMKKYHSEEIEDTAKEIRTLCNKYKAIFILNDNVAIAKNCNADGVHLGLTDMPINKARAILGSEKIIGGTANTLQEVVQRINENCNYIGLGPYKFTNTKENLSPTLGIEGYQNIISQLNDVQLKTPIYAIGGIMLEDVEALLQTNVSGICASGMITNTENKKHLLKHFNSLMYELA